MSKWGKTGQKVGMNPMKHQSYIVYFFLHFQIKNDQCSLIGLVTWSNVWSSICGFYPLKIMMKEMNMNDIIKMFADNFVVAFLTCLLTWMLYLYLFIVHFFFSISMKVILPIRGIGVSPLRFFQSGYPLTVHELLSVKWAKS